jgi:hypothetical protein
MSAPTIQIQVGFQTTANFGTPFQLDNPTFGELDTGTLGGVQLVDVTDQGESISITRGRNRETEQFNAGTATVVFDDPQRIFDPLNTASPTTHSWGRAIPSSSARTESQSSPALSVIGTSTTASQLQAT